MNGNTGRYIGSHLRRHALLYFVIVGAFFAGILGGSFLVGNLGTEQESELLKYLDLFLNGLSQWNVEPSVVAQHAVANNLKIVFYIWFLGLTVIGVPLVLLIVFARGFVMGFTVGFLVQQKALEGILITALAIVPPALVYLPAVIVGAASAVSFSHWLVRVRSRDRSGSLLQNFGRYCCMMLAVAAVAAAGGVVEALVSPTFIKIISNLALS